MPAMHPFRSQLKAINPFPLAPLAGVALQRTLTEGLGAASRRKWQSLFRQLSRLYLQPLHRFPVPLPTSIYCPRLVLPFPQPYVTHSVTATEMMLLRHGHGGLRQPLMEFNA